MTPRMYMYSVLSTTVKKDYFDRIVINSDCDPNFLLGSVVQDFGASRLVQLYAPPTANIDGNLAILWILAVGTMAFGAYWAGITNSKLL